MANYYYNLYCDESGIERKGGFYFGGIHCSPERAKRLEAQIAAFRERTGCLREMKWTKVSAKMLPSYIEFTNIFFEDAYATFVLTEVQKGDHWLSLGRTEEERFFQAYFRFLSDSMWANARYKIYLDNQSCKKYRWKSLHYVMNMPYIRHKTQKKIIALSAVDSHDQDLVQLVDVLLGALVSTAIAPAKTTLSEYVRKHLNAKTKTGLARIKTSSWTPPQSLRFKPKI